LLLPKEHKDYLQAYLDKVSDYKVIGTYQESPVFSLYQPPLLTPAGQRSLAMRLKRRFEKQRIPAVATIAVNQACQCECHHCSAVHYNHSPVAGLNPAELDEALRQTVALGVTNLILLGGEPLLRKDLVSLIAAVPKEQSHVILFTNGEFLTRDLCRQLARVGVLGVFVSLDHTDHETHDRLRKRPDLFSKAMAGIQNLREAEVLVGISSYLSPDRLAEGGFEAMMELGKRIGVNEVTFFDAIPSGQWLHNETCLLQPSDRLKIWSLVKHYRRQPDYPGLSVQSTMTSEAGSSFCFAANTQFYLTAQGHMCPCDFTPLTIGQFPEHSIADLWKKMIHTEPYNCRASCCRMQDPKFRQKYINNLPDSGPFPFPISSNTRP
jgi:MoaA/NifB/PqqE/SkfB family radical SAM enzyme